MKTERTAIEEFTKEELIASAEIMKHLRMHPISFRQVFLKCVEAVDDKELSRIFNTPDIDTKMQAFGFALNIEIDDIKTDFLNDMIKNGNFKK